jgi:hypothetical protein
MKNSASLAGLSYEPIAELPGLKYRAKSVKNLKYGLSLANMKTHKQMSRKSTERMTSQIQIPSLKSRILPDRMMG